MNTFTNPYDSFIYIVIVQLKTMPNSSFFSTYLPDLNY